jgi:hypothetical protein
MNETRSAYGPAERAELQAMDGMFRVSVDPEVARLLTMTVTTKLRQVLPDLDDLTIGRVLVALVKDVPAMFDPAISDLQLILIALNGAGLELTEGEWKE